ncbi:hypothetical protein V8C35DRAFT_105406 [Trichoderma chlorosporum]
MFNSDAFEIVLRIIHAQADKVPEELSLDMLTNVAVIADDLQYTSPLLPFVKLWTSKKNIWEWPKVFNAAIQQVFVSWIFKLGEIFKAMTRRTVLLSHPNLKLDPGSLPMPSSIFKAMEEKRKIVLQEYLKHLYAVETELKDESFCLTCRTENIGYLRYNLHLHKLPTSESSPEWNGISCMTLRKKMEEFKYSSRPCVLAGKLKHSAFKIHIADALKKFSSPSEGMRLSSFSTTAQ